jgi:hypothetical protein
LASKSMLVQPVVPVGAVPPPALPLPSTVELPIVKAWHKRKLAPPPLASLGPKVLVPQPPRHPPPRVMYGPMPPNFPPPVSRSRSPPRGTPVPWRRPLRTPSKSPPVAHWHSHRSDPQGTNRSEATGF